MKIMQIIYRNMLQCICSWARGENIANRTTRTETPSRCDQPSRDGGEDSDGRNAGQHQVGPGSIRQGGSEGARGIVDAGTPVGDCQGGGGREVGVMRQKAPIIEVKPNRQKILEAIVFLVSEADRLKKIASQYDIVKSVFLADRKHLNEFGRPITFDRYVAMKHGPVPSTVYDFLKKNPENEELPWKREKVDETVFRFYAASRVYNDDILSESDKAALSDSFIIVKSLGFQQIRKLTHEDPAYIDAWEDDDILKAFDMSYVMLFDVPDFNKAADVAFFSENI